MLRFFALPVAAALVAPSAIAADAPVNLFPTLKPGTQVRFQTEGSRTETTELPGATADTTQKLVSSSKFTGTVVLNVAETTGDDRVFTLTIESLKGELTMPDGTNAWDSAAAADDRDPNNPAYRAFRPLVGLISTFTIAPDGTVTVTGGEALNIPREPWMQHAAFLSSNENVRSRWTRILLPKETPGPVKVGESWSDVDEQITPLGKYSTTTQRSLKSAGEGVAEIDLTGTVAIGPSEAVAEPTMKVASSKITGNVRFDTTAGMASEGSSTQTVMLDGSAGGLPIKRTVEWSFSAKRAK